MTPKTMKLSDLAFAKPSAEHGDALREALGENWRQTLDDLLAQGRWQAGIDAEYERQARLAFEQMEAEGKRPN